MAWQILAMLVIVFGAVIWFVRDERSQRALALQLAARHYATSPRYRHRRANAPSEAPSPSPSRAGGLSPAQRAYFHQFLARR